MFSGLLILGILQIKIDKLRLRNSNSTKFKSILSIQYLFQWPLCVFNRRKRSKTIFLFLFSTVYIFFHYLLYLYNQYASFLIIFLIMIKRFAFAIFRNNNRKAYTFCTAPKSNPQEEARKKQFKQKLNQQEKQDEEEPSYQKEDRTTPGWMLYRLIFWGSFFTLSYNIYLVHQHQKKTPVEDQPTAIPGFITVAKQIYKNINDAAQFLTKPPVDKLLPNTIHPLMQPKTLVLNLSDTLIKSQYIFGKGLVIHKRPGLNQFLKKVSQIYEVVIFSNDDSMFLSTVLPSIDPRHQMIAGLFGKQCMVYSGGHYIKDLKYLNRDLNKIVVVDIDRNNVKKHPQNVVLLSHYKGDESDRQLLALTSLLQGLARPEVKDVRKTLEQLGQNPLQQYEKMLKQKQEKFKKNSRVFGFFGNKK